MVTVRCSGLCQTVRFESNPPVGMDKPKPEPPTPEQSVLGYSMLFSVMAVLSTPIPVVPRSLDGIARYVAWLPPRRCCSVPGRCRAGWVGSGRRLGRLIGVLAVGSVAGLDIRPADQAVFLLVAA